MARTRDIGRAAAALRGGEALATRISARQAVLAQGPAARFFAVQAQQEAFHVRVAAAAAATLAAGAARTSPIDAPLAALGARLDRDLDAGDLAASVVGLQVGFEAIGIAVLGHLEAVVAAHVPGLAAVHRRVALQEAAHHAFGVRYIERSAIPAARLAAAAGEYGALAGRLLTSCVEITDRFGVPAEGYRSAFAAVLPDWFRGADDA